MFSRDKIDQRFINIALDVPRSACQELAHLDTDDRLAVKHSYVNVTWSESTVVMFGPVVCARLSLDVSRDLLDVCDVDGGQICKGLEVVVAG